MALYRSSFERTNFGICPILKQTADVLLQTDIPFDDANIEAFQDALWGAVWEQNPHWADSKGPRGAATGWSSVLGGHKVELIKPDANMAFAWHIPQKGWLLADGVTATEDVEQAARFSIEQIIALQATYPGERYSMVMPKLVSEVYNEDGTSRCHAKFQLRYDEFVVWGLGERMDMRYDRLAIAKRPIAFGLTLDFELPSGPYYEGAQVYETRTTWAWRLFNDDAWHPVATIEEAEAAARVEALEQMRKSGEHNCEQWLAIKYNREVTNAVEQREVKPNADD